MSSIFTNDYSAEDHGTCLVLVAGLGSVSLDDSFIPLFNRIEAVTSVSVTSSSHQRHLHLRYKRQKYSLEENGWGDFQSHRKCLGLLCIAHCKDAVELAEMSVYYDAMRQR